jgi:hypothetical protein
MPQFRAKACALADASAIANVNISAFWQDPSWVLMWPNKSREYVTTQAVLRMPFTLLRDPVHKRHQKVIDDNGKVLGYARWTLPSTGNDETVLWPEACVETVSDEEIHKAEMEYKSAWWDYDRSLDVLDNPIDEIRNSLYDPTKHICMSNSGETQSRY